MGMKFRYNMEVALHDLDGKRIKISKFPGSREMLEATLGKALRFAVLNIVENGPDGQPINLTGQAKFERYELARKIQKGGIIEFEEEERNVMRMLVGEGFPVEAVGAIWPMLDAPLTDEQIKELEAEAAEKDEGEAKKEEDEKGSEASTG